MHLDIIKNQSEKKKTIVHGTKGKKKQRKCIVENKTDKRACLFKMILAVTVNLTIKFLIN